MCMEVITPTRTDTDGGYLVGEPSGSLRLVELVEVPLDKKDAFRAQHKLFNTNNIWVNLKALKRLMDSGDGVSQAACGVYFQFMSYDSMSLK